MLKKLLKYEFQATARTFGGIYLAILATALVMGVSLRFSGSASSFSQWNSVVSSLNVLGTSWAVQLAAIGSFCYFALVVAMFVVLFVTICQRFYKNLLGSEGYLMHTLPVTPAMLLASKTLIALLWSLLSVLVLFVSMLMLAFLVLAGATFGFGSLVQYLRYFKLAPDFYWVVPMLCASYVGTLLLIYLAMMIGHQFNKGAIFIAVIAYFLINALKSWLNIGLAWVIDNTPLAYLSAATPIIVDYSCVVLLQLGFAAVYFALTAYLLRKRLNLV